MTKFFIAFFILALLVQLSNSQYSRGTPQCKSMTYKVYIFRLKYYIYTLVDQMMEQNTEFLVSNIESSSYVAQHFDPAVRPYNF